jgi:hypothetical protein
LNAPPQTSPSEVGVKRKKLRRRYGHADARKVVATSYERYNGGARTKRMYGGSTITRFFVHYAEDRNDPLKWEKIEGYGPTPGERKTYAIQEFLRRHP